MKKIIKAFFVSLSLILCMSVFSTPAYAAKEIKKEDYKTVEYKTIARDKDGLKGDKFQISGKILQVMESDDGLETQFRIATSEDGYDDVYLVGISNDELDSRLLEDDYVNVYGLSVGIITYQSTMGGNISIPGLYADKIELQ